jgi:hypothetical protein
MSLWPQFDCFVLHECPDLVCRLLYLDELFFKNFYLCRSFRIPVPVWVLWTYTSFALSRVVTACCAPAEKQNWFTKTPRVLNQPHITQLAQQFDVAVVIESFDLNVLMSLSSSSVSRGTQNTNFIILNFISIFHK